jgi:hypothetical protein
MSLQFCAVCSRGSTRPLWNKTGNVNGISYVACDFHSQAVTDISVIDSGGIPSTTQVYPAQNNRWRKQILESGGE